jgi:hypothetical protein
MSKEWHDMVSSMMLFGIAFWVEGVLGSSGLLRTMRSMNGDGARTSRG